VQYVAYRRFFLSTRSKVERRQGIEISWVKEIENFSVKKLGVRLA
jgi:hypothetical protein